MKRRMVSIGTSVLMIGGALVGVATPAQARCDLEGQTYWGKVYSKSAVFRASSLRSKWMDIGDGSNTVSFSDSKSGSWSASGTAGVSAEAGVIFAKASASFSITVGKTWQSGTGWGYTMALKKKQGKTQGRMVLMHEARKFKINKYVYKNNSSGGCVSKLTDTRAIVAPTKRDSNDYWTLQYR